MRKDVDDATMVRVDLERKIEGLREELEYSRKVRNEEIEDLKQQIEEQGINVEVDGITPDMNQILAQIRQEYDEIAVKNRDEAEQWYKVGFNDRQRLFGTMTSFSDWSASVLPRFDWRRAPNSNHQLRNLPWKTLTLSFLEKM